MEALGQREVLRILYEADDQCDAAGMIITEAAAKSPGASLQFMIGFVESATVADKPARNFGIGRGRSAPVQASAASLPVPPADLSDVPALFDPAKRQPSAAGQYNAPAREQEPDVTLLTQPANYAFQESDEPLSQESDAIAPAFDIPDISDRRQAPEYSPAKAYAPPAAPPRDRHTGVFPDAGQPDDEDDGRPYGRSRVGMYIIIAIVAVAAAVALYLIFRESSEPLSTTAGSAWTTGSTAGSKTSATAATSTATTKAGTTTTASKATAATTIATTVTIDPATPTSLPAAYTVKSGDTLFKIASYFYKSGDAYYVQLIKDANGLQTDTLFVDQKLVIPVVPPRP
jgi:LysM repeat protein